MKKSSSTSWSPLAQGRQLRSTCRCVWRLSKAFHLLVTIIWRFIAADCRTRQAMQAATIWKCKFGSMQVQRVVCMMLVRRLELSQSQWFEATRRGFSAPMQTCRAQWTQAMAL
mmetsp:Transcript_70634/g.206785  ORF Transcript_70634/g.206785 Transcript_70634/m.206785 type:complete len:113 (-) Transcript_70634:72-410(-)